MRKYRNRPRNRRGATVLELSLTLLVFLTLTLGVLDLGIGVFRSHVLSQAARHAARRAAVHGELSNTPWHSETPLSVSANDNSEDIVSGQDDGIQAMLVGCDLANTDITINWLDGSNEVDQRVRVTITSPYQPAMSFIFGNNQRTLSASSTMRIAH